MEYQPDELASERPPKPPMPKLDLSALTKPWGIYIVEYFFIFVMLGTAIGGTIGLFNIVIDHFFEEPVTLSYYSSSNLGGLAAGISAILVALPLLTLLFLRTRRAEKEDPSLLKSNARRRITIVFIVLAVLCLLGYFSAWVYGSVYALISADSSTSEYGGEGWVETTIKYFFAIGLIKLSIVFMAKLQPRGNKKEVRRGRA